MRLFKITLASVLVLLSMASYGDEGLLAIQHEWAVINYSELEDDDKVDALLALTDKAESLVKQAPNGAEGYIWLGIIQSTTAGAKGGLGALKYAKAAKKSFEKALRLDETALQGSAMTSLGVLYHKVPGWPIGFGSDKKAEILLTKALSLNSDGIDPNFFYAEYLFDEREYGKAMKYLAKAQAAAPRPDRPLADKGRRKEVEQLKQKVLAKMN
jgi:cytochrome c-type biogenesis protein CcmH/NrfG